MRKRCLILRAAPQENNSGLDQQTAASHRSPSGGSCDTPSGDPQEKESSGTVPRPTHCRATFPSPMTRAGGPIQASHIPVAYQDRARPDAAGRIRQQRAAAGAPALARRRGKHGRQSKPGHLAIIRSGHNRRRRLHRGYWLAAEAGLPKAKLSLPAASTNPRLV